MGSEEKGFSLILLTSVKVTNCAGFQGFTPSGNKTVIRIKFLPLL